MTQSAAKAFSWLMAEKLLRVLNGLVVTAAVARYLGPETYGILSVALGALAVLNAAATMGADHVNVSELAKRQSEGGAGFLASASLARLLWSLACVAGMLAFVGIARPEAGTLILQLTAVIPVVVFGIFGDQLLAHGKYREFAMLSSAAIVVGALIRLVGIALEADVAWFAWAVVAESVLLVVLLIGGAIRLTGLRRAEFRVDGASAWTYFRLCLPMAASTTLMVLDSRLELLVIDALASNTAAGLWAAAQMFVLPWSMIAVSIVASANRGLAGVQDQPDVYRRRMVQLIRRMALAGCAAAAFNVLAAYLVIPLLLGGRYAQAIDIVSITSLLIVSTFVSVVQEISIAHRRATYVVLKRVLLGLPLSMALLVLLLPRFGIVGAAYGAVLSKYMMAFVFNAMFDREFMDLQLEALGLRRAVRPPPSGGRS